MTGWGASLATWWVRRYTETAVPAERTDRRAEVAADLHDHYAAAAAAANGRSPSRVDRQVAGRVLRGAPADLTWRLAREAGPDRVAWHLSHPVTLLGALVLPMVGPGVFVDSARDGAAWLAEPVAVAEAVALPLHAAAVAVAVVAPVRSLRRRPHRPSLVGARRTALAALSVTWGLAALWRFAPGLPGTASTLGWAAFGLSLLGWAALAAAAGLRQVLALRKVPS